MKYCSVIIQQIMRCVELDHVSLIHDQYPEIDCVIIMISKPPHAGETTHTQTSKHDSRITDNWLNGPTPDGYISGLVFNRHVHCSFRGNWTIVGWNIANSIFDLEFKVNVVAKVKPDGHIWCLEFIQYVCFSLLGNRTISVWDIKSSIPDLENSRSRSNPILTIEA